MIIDSSQLIKSTKPTKNDASWVGFVATSQRGFRLCIQFIGFVPDASTKFLHNDLLYCDTLSVTGVLNVRSANGTDPGIEMKPAEPNRTRD